jgi:PAS domain S-box-containing protein
MSKVGPAVRRMTSTVMRYGLAVLCAVAASLVTELLQYFTNGPPWFIFLAAVMLSSWVAGLGPGLLAVLLSLAAVDYFFVPPLYILSLKIEYLPRLVVFGLSALLVGWLSDRRKRANLLDLTNDTVFVRDMSDVITYWNRGAKEQYGWAREEAVGQVSHDILQTIFPAPSEEINAELLRTGRWEGELVHTRRDGTQVVVASRWALQRDERGHAIAILETNNDITDRRRAEEGLRESERRYRNIFEAAGVSIWEEDFSRVKAAIAGLKAQGVWDFRGYLAAHPELVRHAISLVRIAYVNDATVKLFGAGSKAALLVSLHAIFKPETQDVFSGELVAIAEGRTAFESEAVLQTLQGDKLAVLFTMTCPPQPAPLDRCW